MKHGIQARERAFALLEQLSAPLRNRDHHSFKVCSLGHRKVSLGGYPKIALRATIRDRAKEVRKA
jgi:hypothetical protein